MLAWSRISYGYCCQQQASHLMSPCSAISMFSLPASRTCRDLTTCPCGMQRITHGHGSTPCRRELLGNSQHHHTPNIFTHQRLFDITRSIKYKEAAALLRQQLLQTVLCSIGYDTTAAFASASFGGTPTAEPSEKAAFILRPSSDLIMAVSLPHPPSTSLFSCCHTNNCNRPPFWRRQAVEEDLVKKVRRRVC
jgi:hypothetical protein